MAVIGTSAKAKIIIGVIASCVSLGLGIYAFAAYNATTSYFFSVIENWQKEPVVDITYQNAGSCSGTSPAGWSYETIDHLYDFKYTYYECDCTKAKAPKPTPAPYTKCTSAQEDRNCTTDSTRDALSVPRWRSSSTLCLTRFTGQNAIVRRRTTGDCPIAYHKCNVIDCYPEAHPCPVSNVKVFANVAAAQAAGFNETVVMPGTTSVLAIARADLTAQVFPMHELRQADFAGSDMEGQYQNFDTMSEVALLQSNSHQTALTTKNVWSDVVGAGRTWTMSYRPEVKWAEDCPKDRSALVDVQGPVDDIHTALSVVMGLSIFAFIVNIGLTILDYKAKTDNNDSNDDAWVRPKTAFGLCAEICNLIPTIIAMAIAFKYVNFFSKLKDSSCSDETTNAQFTELSDKIITTGQTTIAKTAVSAVYLIYRIYVFIRGPKKDTTSSDTKHVGPQAEMNMPPKESTSAPGPDTAYPSYGQPAAAPVAQPQYQPQPYQPQPYQPQAYQPQPYQPPAAYDPNASYPQAGYPAQPVAYDPNATYPNA